MTRIYISIYFIPVSCIVIYRVLEQFMFFFKLSFTCYARDYKNWFVELRVYCFFFFCVCVCLLASDFQDDKVIIRFLPIFSKYFYLFLTLVHRYSQIYAIGTLYPSSRSLFVYRLISCLIPSCFWNQWKIVVVTDSILDQLCDSLYRLWSVTRKQGVGETWLGVYSDT